jgi:D-serine deaminase-like pyridoxal phosphate-dependent protein
MPTYEYYRDVFAGRRLPLAYVDLDLFDMNIAEVARRANGTPVRVASKSVRSVALLRRIVDADPIFQGIMAFSAPEAVWLSEQGFDDLLIGYPTWHAPSVRAVAEAIRAGKTIVLMIDSVEHIAHLEAIAAEMDVVLPVCLDVDMSIDLPGLHFGVWRSSVTDATGALRVYEAIETADHVRLDGVMGYEAQIAGVGERTPGQLLKNAAVRLLKRQAIPQIAERRRRVVNALTVRGAELRFVNGGGTGSIESTVAEDVITEVTAGSGFYSPGLFDYYEDFRHLPAAGFAVEIVRQPKPDIYTCHGGGYIASGAVGAEKAPGVHLPKGAELTDLEGAGEVQTPVRYSGPEALRLGDPVLLRHAKAGELCEHFNTLLLVQQGEIVDEVLTYRGEGCVFL